MKPLDRLLLLTVAAAAVLAGCAAPEMPGDDADVTPPRQMTQDEARQALAEAVADMPDLFGLDMRILVGGDEAARIEGRFDNATQRSYLTMTLDADMLANLTGGEAPMGGGGDQVIQVYAAPAGSLYLVNGTAFVFPPSEGEEDGGFVPSPGEGPAGAFLDPEETLLAFAEENLNVTSVTPTVHRGRPAVVVAAETKEENRTMPVKVTLFLDPARIARVEAALPADEDEDEDEEGAFAGGHAEADFYYGDEVEVAPPESVVRALGLAYRSDREPFSFEESANFTWTFLHSEGIPLDEVEAHVKGEPEDEGDADFSLAGIPNVFTMRLSEGERTEGGVTLTFTDADGDGEVSAGDTLSVRVPEGEALPTVALYDAKTGTYVVPGPGLALAALAAAGAAALLQRKRRS